jgi:hypothetical protein
MTGGCIELEGRLVVLEDEAAVKAFDGLVELNEAALDGLELLDSFRAVLVTLVRSDISGTMQEQPDSLISFVGSVELYELLLEDYLSTDGAWWAAF